MDYVLVMNQYATPLHMVANKNSWANFTGRSEDHQDLLEEFPRKIGEQYVREDEAGYKQAEAGYNRGKGFAKSCRNLRINWNPLSQVSGWMI